MTDIKERISLNEKTFNSLRKVTYYFEEGKRKDHLIIIFSAVNPPNIFNYNYVSTLSYLDCNKLYILDKYGDQGAYYLGENKDYSIESSVVSLINQFIKKYNISFNNIITVGSSKGGYAALYYSIKYNFGTAIVGGPQTRLGDFLYDQGKNFSIAEYIAGPLNNENKGYLNSLLFKIIESKGNYLPDLYIHVGRGDHHYKNHIKPLTELLDVINENSYELDIQDYNSHDGLRTYFPYFLIKTLCKIVGTPIEEVNPIKKINVHKYGNKFQVTCELVTEKTHDFSFAFYLYKDGKVNKKYYYSENSTFSSEVTEKGLYKYKVFVKNHQGNKYIQMSDEISFD